MSTQKRFNIAVVGASGAVGEQLIRLLDERNFPIQELKLLASARSAGATIEFRGSPLPVLEAGPESFEGVDIVLFSAGGAVSERLVPEAVARGAVCIDNTNAFRMDPDTPLIVPEVNLDRLSDHKGLIANPNCSTIQLVVALKPLHDRYRLRRIIVSTYQAVSGAGAKAAEELRRQTGEWLAGRPIEPGILPVASLPVKHQMAFNVVPQIDKFLSDGYTNEEMKMVNETKKIMGDSSIEVTATCARVPVFRGHSESVYAEFEEAPDLREARRLLAEAPGVAVQDDPSEQRYPLAVEAAGKPEVYVGRLRRDLANPRALNMWIVSDNLLKGAAWNAVQIAEYIALQQA